MICSIVFGTLLLACAIIALVKGCLVCRKRKNEQVLSGEESPKINSPVASINSRALSPIKEMDSEREALSSHLNSENENDETKFEYKINDPCCASGLDSDQDKHKFSISQISGIQIMPTEEFLEKM